VQPAGSLDDWSTAPFEPAIREGRMYGRGASDDKAGVVTHLGALRLFEGRPPVGIKVLVEGEEELGSPHIEALFAEHAETLRADVVVIADSTHWRLGEPSLTTSLRGVVDCVVAVRVLEAGVHSGVYGGAMPDALMALAWLLATLHDDRGEVAVGGLHRASPSAARLDAADVREQARVRPGVELFGDDDLTTRTWRAPAVSILGIDAPSIAEAINQIVPVARAKVSLRIAPGEDVTRAMTALVAHLEAHAPWGAEVTVTPGSSADAFEGDTAGPVYDRFRTAIAEAWGRPPLDIGVGGTIPLVPGFARAFPEATIVITGVGEPLSRMHGPDESQDLRELRRNVLAEARALELLGRGEL
jgi:acetylornithine deacetylase/succinyl-diaminopimelate desuccinylase-like protein